MLYYLLTLYDLDYGFFNLFNYITVRSGLALLTSLFLGLLIGKPVIAWLKRLQQGAHNIREYVPRSHQKKAGTPSLGGVLILLCWLPSVILWGDLGSGFIWGLLYLVLAFAALGFWDDYRKIKKEKGLSLGRKLFWQCGLAIPGILLLQLALPLHLREVLLFPVFKDAFMDLGVFYLVFMACVVIGSSNAVNFTDGLDGLAIGSVIIAVGSYALIVYLTGHRVYADYLQIGYIAGSGEVAIFCSALVGAGLAFLWYNCMPAEIFMGDTGSLPLGAALGGIAISAKHELQLLVIGGLFVVEAGSVILQIGFYRLGGGRRLFRKAPFHHHWEELGLSESKITVRLWILAAIFALLGLASLKLR